MNKNKKLIIDTFIYAVGSFGSKMLSFLMLPLYTDYFTTTEYGLWDLVFTTITLLTPFISFEILNAVYRWLLDCKDKEERDTIISTGFFFTLRNMLIFNVFAVILLNAIHISYGVLAVILINLSILNDFIQKCVRGCGHNKQFAIIGIIQTIVIVSSNLFFIFVLGLRLETLFYSSILSNIAGILIGWFTLKFHKYLSFNLYSKVTIKSFLKYSIPTIPGAVNWWIMNASDRFLIAFGLGVSANGIYAVSNKLPTIITLISTVFFLAWQDNAITSYNDEDRDQYYSSVFKYFFRLMVTSCILLVLTSRIIMNFIVDVEFDEAWKYTGLLYIAAVYSSFASFWGAGFQGSKQTTIIFKTTIAGAIANLLINACLIWFIGLYAATISTVVAFIIMWIMRVVNNQKDFKITVNKRDMIILTLILFISLPISFCENIVITAVSIILGIIIFIVYNIDFFKNLIVKIKTKKANLSFPSFYDM